MHVSDILILIHWDKKWKHKFGGRPRISRVFTDKHIERRRERTRELDKWHKAEVPQLPAGVNKPS